MVKRAGIYDLFTNFGGIVTKKGSGAVRGQRKKGNALYRFYAGTVSKNEFLFPAYNLSVTNISLSKTKYEVISIE